MGADRTGRGDSQSQDWNHPGADAIGGHSDPAQDGSMDDYIAKIAVPQVRELLTNYGPVAVLWWDTPDQITPEQHIPATGIPGRDWETCMTIKPPAHVDPLATVIELTLAGPPEVDIRSSAIHAAADGSLHLQAVDMKYTCYACAIMPDHVHLIIRKHKHLAEEMIQNLQQASSQMLKQEKLFAVDHPVWTPYARRLRGR